MKRKFTTYPQSGIKASKRIYSASNISDFEINEHGRLVRYAGPGGDVVIPDSVTSIEEYAFYECASVTSIKIPNSVTEIGWYAFSGCTSLTSITIPDGVTSIDDYTFSCCTSLSSITIPDSVTSIGLYAFSGCTSLTSITIPDSVTSIGDNAFYNCNKLPEDVKNYISQFPDSDEYSDDDDEYEDGEMSFEDWYDSSQGEADGMEFVDKLESLVRSNYNVDDFFEEPSTQGYQGGDFIWITLSDGSKYEFEFDWYDEQVSIYEDGPEATAKSYFKEIQEGIDSGSALVK